MEEIGKTLPAVFKRQFRRGEPQLAEILAPLWPRAVGRAIAEHSRPVGFAAGTLTLEADSRTWAVQLEQMQAQIADAVNVFLRASVVKGLRVRVTTHPPHPGAAPEAKSYARGSSEPLAAEFNPEIGADADPSRILARSYAKYFARRERKGD